MDVNACSWAWDLANFISRVKCSSSSWSWNFCFSSSCHFWKTTASALNSATHAAYLALATDNEDTLLSCKPLREEQWDFLPESPEAEVLDMIWPAESSGRNWESTRAASSVLLIQPWTSWIKLPFWTDSCSKDYYTAWASSNYHVVAGHETKAMNWPEVKAEDG